MIITRIEGQLEIDHERGVIYFHSPLGYSVLRICGLGEILKPPEGWVQCKALYQLDYTWPRTSDKRISRELLERVLDVWGQYDTCFACTPSEHNKLTDSSYTSCRRRVELTGEIREALEACNESVRSSQEDVERLCNLADQACRMLCNATSLICTEPVEHTATFECNDLCEEMSAVISKLRRPKND